MTRNIFNSHIEYQKICDRKIDTINQRILKLESEQKLINKSDGNPEKPDSFIQEDLYFDEFGPV